MERYFCRLRKQQTNVALFIVLVKAKNHTHSHIEFIVMMQYRCQIASASLYGPRLVTLKCCYVIQVKMNRPHPLTLNVGINKKSLAIPLAIACWTPLWTTCLIKIKKERSSTLSLINTILRCGLDHRQSNNVWQK
jgi:hypothetical protein